MPVSIPIPRLLRHCHPFRSRPWGVPVRPRDVWEALATGRLVAAPGGDDHAGRIAYLMIHPSQEPIEIDVGVPGLGCYVDWLVQDGNHRLAAAFMRREPSIMACVSGDLHYAHELFGIDCEEEDLCPQC